MGWSILLWTGSWTLSRNFLDKWTGEERIQNYRHLSYESALTQLFSPLKALQYLRKLCNHPALVLTPQHPEFKSTTEKLTVQNSSLHDIQHAPKLSALKQVRVSFNDKIMFLTSNTRTRCFSQSLLMCLPYAVFLNLAYNFYSFFKKMMYHFNCAVLTLHPSLVQQSLS